MSAATIGYHGATHLLTNEMRRAGCGYLLKAGMASPWDIGHEALIRSLAEMPVEYLSEAGRMALLGKDRP